MKIFLKYISLFIFMFLVFFVTLKTGISSKVNNARYYKVQSNIKSIILGHSHVECAYNDLLIDSFRNFGHSGEAYFYTYYKLKKILESNDQLENVFVEFTNNRISQGWGKGIYEDKYLEEMYFKYSNVIDAEGIRFLMINNPLHFINIQAMVLKDNILFLNKKNAMYFDEFHWGKYFLLRRNRLSEMLRDRKEPKKVSYPAEKVNLVFLTKIKQLCFEKKLNLILIRTPVHPLDPRYRNEEVFQNVLSKRLSDLDFLDFSSLKFQATEYADFNHLNYKGAKRYSIFFNNLLKKGLLYKKNKQLFIDNQINEFNQLNNYETNEFYIK